MNYGDPQRGWPRPWPWWIWLVIVAGLAAWAVPVYLIGMGAKYERIRVCTYTCAQGWKNCPETESCEWMTREKLWNGAYRWLTTGPKTVDTKH